MIKFLANCKIFKQKLSIGELFHEYIHEFIHIHIRFKKLKFIRIRIHIRYFKNELIHIRTILVLFVRKYSEYTPLVPVLYFHFLKYDI